MAVREVILFGHPVLRKKSKRVGYIEGQETQRIMKDLKDTLMSLQRKHKKGGGLAAVQIVHLKRIIYIRAAGKSFYLINPRMVQKSRQKFEVWDFCFSGAAAFMGRVKRHKIITMEFQDEKGEKKVETYKDYFSELIQHEYDHLEGKLFIDYIDKPERIMMMEQWDKQFKYTQV